MALEPDWITAKQVAVHGHRHLLDLAPLTSYLGDYMHIGSVSASLEGEIKN